MVLLNKYKEAETPTREHFKVVAVHIMTTKNDELRMDQVDSDTDYLVSGLLRQVQSQSTDPLFQFVPGLVILTCIQFYHVIEGFVECGSKMEINEDGKFVKLTVDVPRYQGVRDHKNTAYGAIKISSIASAIYCWTFRIVGEAGYLVIGILSNELIDVNKRFTEQSSNKDYFYGYSNGGYEYGKELDVTRNHTGMHMHGFFRRDYIQMIVNTNTKMVRFFVSKDEKGKSVRSEVVFNNIHFEEETVYRMAVSIGWPGSGVELINFQKLSAFDCNDGKWQAKRFNVTV